jgi:hypothetical protein
MGIHLRLEDKGSRDQILLAARPKTGNRLDDLRFRKTKPDVLARNERTEKEGKQESSPLSNIWDGRRRERRCFVGSIAR